MGGTLENALVLGGAALDSYLTTKQAGTFGKGIMLPSASGSKVSVPYSEVVGIAGGLAVPFVSRKKWANYLGKFLTGMGANGIAKVADPPMKMEKIPEKATWEVVTCL